MDENGPFIDDLPIKTSIYKGFSMAMLVITRWYIYIYHIHFYDNLWRLFMVILPHLWHVIPMWIHVIHIKSPQLHPQVLVESGHVQLPNIKPP